MVKKRNVLFCAVLALAGICQGAGFTILEQSANGMGRALAGMAADTEDPSALYFNPATPAWSETAKISLGTHFLYVGTGYEDRGSDPVAGHHAGGNYGGWSYIPNLYYVQPITKNISFGLGFSATSGTRMDYCPKWLGRYTSIETEIAVMDMSPVIAWKITDNLSIGGGLLTEYADMTMSRALSLPQLGATGLEYRDGQMKMQGDSVALGYTFGILYEPFAGTKIGLGYRSRMKHDVDLKGRVRKGQKTKELLGMMNPGAEFYTSSDGDATLHLPTIINFGVEQKVTDRLKLMGDVSWAEWSVMKDITIKFDRPVLGTQKSKLDMKWGDNWKFSLGGTYDLTDKLTLRAGLAFDKTPVKDKWRNTCLPDANRYWVSLGFGYKFNEHITLNMAYTHLFMEHVSYTQAYEAQGSTHYLKGRAVDCSSDIYSLAVTYSF